ncbi:Small conductance calcium-activated potassium channel protein 3, partial [Ophiophagus hannah]
MDMVHAALSLVYLVTEYCAPGWLNSLYTNRIDVQLHESMCIARRCPKSPSGHVGGKDLQASMGLRPISRLPNHRSQPGHHNWLQEPPTAIHRGQATTIHGAIHPWAGSRVSQQKCWQPRAPTPTRNGSSHLPNRQALPSRQQQQQQPTQQSTASVDIYGDSVKAVTPKKQTAARKSISQHHHRPPPLPQLCPPHQPPLSW